MQMPPAGDPYVCTAAELARSGGAQDTALAILAAQSRSGAKTIAIDCRSARALPSALIGGLALAGERLRQCECVVRLVGASPEAVMVLRLAQTDTRAPVDLPGAPRDLPFTLDFSETATALVHVPRSAVGADYLGSDESRSWLHGVAIARIAIDLSQVDHVNSMFVAWMLQLGQTAAPIPVELRKLTPQVAIQLRQLRIDLVLHVRA